MMPRLSRERARDEVGAGIATPVVHPPELGEMEDEFPEVPPPPAVTGPRGPGKKALAEGPPRLRPRSTVDEALGLDEEDEEVVESDREQEVLQGFHVECRVVYLGNQPKHSRYFQGSAEEMENDAQSGKTLYKATPSGATTYVFEALDQRERPILSRRTRDNKVFAICRHIGHLALFDAVRDQYGQRLYQVRATPIVRAQIEEYLRRLRDAKARGPDQGKKVLEAMGLA